jgi:hypothetical protein
MRSESTADARGAPDPRDALPGDRKDRMFRTLAGIGLCTAGIVTAAAGAAAALPYGVSCGGAVCMNSSDRPYEAEIGWRCRDGLRVTTHETLTPHAARQLGTPRCRDGSRPKVAGYDIR